MAADTKYLQVFFKEKEIPFEDWSIESKDGVTHFFDTEVIKEFILRNVDLHAKIAFQLRKIDFYNQPVIPFFKYLSQGLVN